jgi:hypothetical protein
MMPAALNGAIPSLHALYKKQRLLFFAKLLVRLHHWHCLEAVRAEADLSVLSILRRIRNGGPRSTLAVSREENLGREDNTSSV